MRRQTRDEAKAELAYVRRCEAVQGIALSVLAGGEPFNEEATWDEGIDGGWRVAARLYRGLSAHGGIVVRVARLAGQRPQVDALNLDDYGTEGRGWVLEDRIAAERLRGTRLAMWDSVRSRQEVYGEPFVVAIQGVTAGWTSGTS